MKSDKEIFTKIIDEYNAGKYFKASLGNNGLFEQAIINERFYVGDQWHGADFGNDKPLVRRNLIKRIGEFKMACIAAAPLTAKYSADGVPTAGLENRPKKIREQLTDGIIPDDTVPSPEEIAVITEALSDYFKTTAERLKLDNIKADSLFDSYITGTGAVYTYWDETIETGLYADEQRTTAIKGDINIETVDIENIVFGEPNNRDIQSQPYIIIAMRKYIDSVKREAKQNGIDKATRDKIIPDRDQRKDIFDERSEPTESNRVTVYLKLWKEFDDSGKSKVYGIKVTDGAVVKKKWCLGINNYPLAVFPWTVRRNLIYGDSEITYLVPNQIAINKVLTAALWSAMMVGMPKIAVNTNYVDTVITNEPGQIIELHGEQTDGCIQYIVPPNVTAAHQSFVENLAQNTLSDSGANEAALGDVRPDNASAIIQMREAATQPLQMYQNRFYLFFEDIARIWADFWVNLYGRRSLKVNDKNGVRYIVFDAERYKSLVLTARIDVGSSTLYSDAVVISTLDNLLSAGLITFKDYLERIPKNIIPDISGLIEAENAKEGTISDDEILAYLKQNYPDQYAEYQKLPPSEQAAMLNSVKYRIQAAQSGAGTGAEQPTV